MDYKNHLLHYLILFLIILGGLFGAWYFSFNRLARFGVVSLSVLGYVVWGVSHHLLEKRLSWGVVLEYILLGFVILAAFSLTLRF